MYFLLKLYQETERNELCFYSFGFNVQDNIYVIYVYVCVHVYIYIDTNTHLYTYITRINRNIYITEVQYKQRCSNATSIAQNIRHEETPYSDLTS